MIKLKKGSPVEVPVYKNMYELVVETMQGDADDYHDFTLHFPIVDGEPSDDLFKAIRLLEKIESEADWDTSLNKYDGFERLFSDEWYFECDYGYWDSLEGYTLFLYDSSGTKFVIDIEIFDEEDDE